MPVILAGVALAGTPARAQTSGDLADLTDLDQLRDVFNRDAGHVRLVALLSPTCAYCVKGYRYMRKLLDEIPDPRLRMYVVWEPILSADTRAVAVKQAGRARDPRLAYQAWDGENVTGKAWQELMGNASTAWDVYYLYDGTHTWNPGLTEPNYYQHQFEGPSELRLNYGRLKEQILAHLEASR